MSDQPKPLTPADEPPVVGGPAEAVTMLFDETPSAGRALHPAFERAHGGRCDLPPARHDRPFTMINFVVSRDGRISFAEPGEVGGASVNGGCSADVWTMGLLRARCDAVLMGDGTLRAEPDHVWTPTHLGGCDAAAFEWLRAHEGRAPVALHVFVSLTGEVPGDAAVMQRDDIEVIVATTTGGLAAASRALGGRSNVEVLAFGDHSVDTAALGQWLMRHRGVQSLLCEGGPGLYGSLLRDGAIDEEFVTLSPTIIGPTATSGSRRPSLVEGASFLPQAHPRSIPMSLRRAGHHLMLRSRIDSGVGSGVAADVDQHTLQETIA